MDNHSIILYVTIFTISYIITQKLIHKYRNLPPSPFPTLPILGHLYLLKNPSTSPTPIHRAIAKVSDRYGPVILLYLGSRRTLLVSSASAAEDCLHHNDVTFASRPRLLGPKIIGYDSTTMLWAPYGPLWRNHRRISSAEILSTHRLNLLSHIRADKVKFLVKKIYLGGEELVVDVKNALVKLTNNVMMRMIAGKRIHGESVDESDFSKRFKMILKELLSGDGAFSAADFFPYLKWVGAHKLSERRFKRVFEKLDKFLKDLVEEQRREMKEEGYVGDVQRNNRNLIQVLIEFQKTDPTYATESIIKGLVEILLLAGTETSSSTMEWALSLLISNPHVLDKAKREINEHVGYDRLVEEADLAHLPYLHCIINETLRLYPAAPILPPHESTRDCVVGGYHIPRGTMLRVNIWAIQNDPKAWDEPEKFKPERFEGVTGDRIGYKFMPFGSGRRACPGENLAVRLIGLTLASLVQCFEFERVGEYDLIEAVEISTRKAKPLEAKFRACKDVLKLLSEI